MASKHYPYPTSDVIAEPFAGSACYSLRHAHKQVLIAETDPHLYKLWSWLINEATEQSVLDIPVNIPEGTDIRALGLSEGQALLLKTWQRTNNVGNCWTISPWGNKPGQWTANARARVAAEHHLVKHWKLFGSADEVFAAVQGTHATLFVDPCYQYNYKYKAAPHDYTALGAVCLAHPGLVIVCEAACPKTGAVPSWLPFERGRRTVTSRRRKGNGVYSNELLYIRQPA